MNYSMDYPAIDGRVITQGHADYCATNGHATYLKEGVKMGFCPRCGAVTEPANLRVWWYKAGTNETEEGELLGFVEGDRSKARVNVRGKIFRIPTSVLRPM